MGFHNELALNLTYLYTLNERKMRRIHIVSIIKGGSNKAIKEVRK